MKTSLKLLLGSFIVVIFLLVIFMIAVKTNLSREFDFDGAREQLRGNNIIKEEIREVGNFYGIDAKYDIKVHIKQDTFQEVKVVADENLLEIIRTEVSPHGILRIETTRRIKKADNRDVYVTVDTLGMLYASSGAVVNSDGAIKVGNFLLEMKKGSIVTLNLNVDKLNVDANSGSILNLEGKTSNASLNIFAGAILKAEDFSGELFVVHASAGSIINLGDIKELDINANSGSIVKYKDGTHLTQVDINSGARLVKH